MKLRKHKKRKQVRIHLDELTIGYLKGMRADRERLGLSRKELSELTGIKDKSIQEYELGYCAPHLSRYLILAEFFGWDIRDTPNYKFACTAMKYQQKKHKKRYGVSVNELCNMTNYSHSSIENALYIPQKQTINSFTAVMKVLDEEKRRSKLM